MSKRRMDVNHRPNTLEENKLILRDLRTRNKIEHRNRQEIEKLFAKLNAEASSKQSKNAKISSGTRQEKMTTEHPYGPLEGFPVGSWWGIRMDCSRDRVHDPFNRDIQEGRYGVVSLCTSHLATSNDVDLGDSLTFTGDKYESDIQSDDPLLRSYHSQVPFRLVRSYNLTNDYAPKTGYRYDGLYAVASHWIGVGSDNEKNHKFALLRLRNQEPSVWHVTESSSGKLSNHAKKSSGLQTRCNAERFSTNLCSDTHVAANDPEIANGSRSRNETLKFSFNKSSMPNGMEKSSIESKKISHDSAIVTRCISNKKIECSSSSNAQTFVSSVESPIHNVANRNHETSSGPPACKLQNTNISIRTDLYESYLHQDPTKVTPMTFCRTYKSVRGPTHVVKHSNVGTLNLNSCGPCPRDREQESQIQSRSGNAKFLSAQSPSSESNRSADRGTPRIVGNATTPTEAKSTTYDRTTSDVNSEIDDSGERPKSAVGERSKAKRLEQKRRDKENSSEDTLNSVEKSSNNATAMIETLCPITRTKSKEIVEAPSTNRDESREEEIFKESHGSLDSLTPDQMLNFIVKQKYHPRAKLLIGSVIGLATGESTILRAYDSLISRQKRWDRSQTMRGQQIVSPNAQGANASNAESSYDCRQGSSGASRKNERCVPKTISKKRMMKERMLQMRLRRTRSSKRSAVKDKKSLTKPSDTISQRLGRSNVTEQKQQPFSKSTILKKSKKRRKKRGGELARLVIDANIGPKIRGPRNRRLRGTTQIFSKKRHLDGDRVASTCRVESSSDVGLKGKKVNARAELSSRRSKRLNSASKTRIPQSRYVERKKSADENERIAPSRYAERKKSERETDVANHDRRYASATSTRLEARVADAKTSSTSLANKGSKRKVPRTRSNSREQRSRSSAATTKRSCCHLRDDSNSRSNRMVDAATQCTDRRDAATSVERDIESVERCESHENSVKVEWIDLDDIKSETHENIGQESLEFENQRYARSNAPENSREDTQMQTRSTNVVPVRPQATKPRINVAQRLSAFVPVNLSDSDFRIARLRSIGFRPIEPAIFPNDKDPLQDDTDCDTNCPGGSSEEPDNSTVTSRVVDEQYNKYTSEETDVVEYMDQELRYQDIEEEEVANVRKNRGKTSKRVTRVGINNKKIEASKFRDIETTKVQRAIDIVEDDADRPWHGWKKSVKNKQAHWIGW